MRIDISNDLIKEASSHAHKRMQFEYDRFGLNDTQRESMIVIGTLGQLVFDQYLTSSQIDHTMEYQAGKYDSFDFNVFGILMEIKTSGFDKEYQYLNLLYAEDQYQSGIRKGFKYAIQIFVNGYSKSQKLIDLSITSFAVIAGYIKFDTIAKFKHKRQYYGDDYKIPLRELTPIETLLKGII